MLRRLQRIDQSVAECQLTERREHRKLRTNTRTPVVSSFQRSVISRSCFSNSDRERVHICLEESPKISPWENARTCQDLASLVWFLHTWSVTCVFRARDPFVTFLVHEHVTGTNRHAPASLDVSCFMEDVGTRVLARSGYYVRETIQLSKTNLHTCLLGIFSLRRR